MESWRREAAQKRWPNLPPQPISSTLAPVPLFKTTFALFRPFRIATRSAVIPSASAFYIYTRAYSTYIPTYTATSCILLLRILAHRTHTEQWEGCLKLDVLVIRRHSYTGRSCNRRPGRLLQATIRICLHNQDNNGNSERRARDYFGQCDIYIYMYTRTRIGKGRNGVLLSCRTGANRINWNCLINFCGQIKCVSYRITSYRAGQRFCFRSSWRMKWMK